MKNEKKKVKLIFCIREFLLIINFQKLNKQIDIIINFIYI